MSISKTICVECRFGNSRKEDNASINMENKEDLKRGHFITYD